MESKGWAAEHYMGPDVLNGELEEAIRTMIRWMAEGLDGFF